MINVAVVDDTIDYLDQVAAQTRKEFDALGSACAVKKYATPEAFLSDCMRTAFDLVLLDIVMPSMSGIDVARSIRKFGGTGAQIIFITSNPEFALESYDVFPLTFITKPMNIERFRAAIKKFNDGYTEHESFSVKSLTGGEKTVIRAAELQYIESRDHTLFYHMSNGETLSAIGNVTRTAEILPEYFAKCHRSFIVNLKRVHTIKRYEFELESGDIIPISKSDYMTVKQKFLMNT